MSLSASKQRCTDIPGMLDFLYDQGKTWVEPWTKKEDRERLGTELAHLLIVIAELGFNLGYGLAMEQNAEEELEAALEGK